MLFLASRLSSRKGGVKPPKANPMTPPENPGVMPKKDAAVRYVYSVLFYAPPRPVEMPRQKFFLFSSLAAIFDRFSVEEIGCSLGHLYNSKVPDGSAFCGKRCIIKREPLVSKRQKCPKFRD